MDVDATLTRLSADPFAPVDLAELALYLARDEYPSLNVDEYLNRLEDYATILRTRLIDTESLADRVTELAHLLFAEEGFVGNAEDYYNPRNSYMNDVLDRKQGIPLTLSLLAIGVGERAGLKILGVGLPGHFVAKAIEGDDEVVFDPFHGGQFLDRAGCIQLVESVTGRPFLPADDVLDAAPPGFIAQRMLNNLKGIYLREKDFARAARITARLVQLVPGDPLQQRDLGVSLIHAGQPGKAIDHLETYLAELPTADDSDTIEDFLKEARKQIARWN